MTDEPDLTGVEALLRSVPQPSEVPPRYAALAKAAALDGGSARDVVRASSRGSWSPRRLFAAAAVAVAAVAVTLALAVNATRSPVGVDHTVTLASGCPAFADASGTIEFGRPDGAMRQAVLRVENLPPAPAGEYYEMWFSSGNDSVGMMAFNTDPNGTVTVRSAVPSGMTWTHCWVTLERESNGKTIVQPVLRST